MVTLDLSHRPLGSVVTCRHLESRLMPNTNYRWYGACILGDAEARHRWTNAVGVGRLSDQDGRQLQMRPARADNLKLRVFPIDEFSAARATQDGGLGAELIGRRRRRGHRQHLRARLRSLGDRPGEVP